MVWQDPGQVSAGYLEIHEVHCQAELGLVQHAISVHIRQGPDLGQDRVGQPGLHHDGLGLAAGQFPLQRGGGREEGGPGGDVLRVSRDQPLGGLVATPPLLTQLLCCLSQYTTTTHSHWSGQQEVFRVQLY